MTAAEAAAHLKVKSRTLVQWAREGKIPGHCISGGTQRHIWRFLKSELDAALRAPLTDPADKRQQ